MSVTLKFLLLLTAFYTVECLAVRDLIVEAWRYSRWRTVLVMMMGLMGSAFLALVMIAFVL